MLINQAVSVSDNVEEKDLLRVENQYWKDMHDSLTRLKQNDDFKRVILDGYFKDKAVNGVSMLATDYVKRGGHRSDVMEQLIAISQLEDYFFTIDNLGSVPEEDEDEASVQG